MVKIEAIERLEYSNLSELPGIAEKIISQAKEQKIWIFEGEMGAGKTTLIKALCESFNIEDNVTSPTFSLVNEYQSNIGKVFYHFDFYRIKDESEALDIGIEEYFYSGDYCFIEWPSKVASLLPQQYFKIQISLDKNFRIIELFNIV